MESPVLLCSIQKNGIMKFQIPDKIHLSLVEWGLVTLFSTSWQVQFLYAYDLCGIVHHNSIVLHAGKIDWN